MNNYNKIKKLRKLERKIEIEKDFDLIEKYKNKIKKLEKDLL